MLFNLDSALGIEFGGDRLRFASLKKGFSDYTLKDFLEVENFRQIPLSELVGRINQFTDETRVNRENVILGFPRKEVIVREIELPIDVEENFDQVIQFQVEKLEPSEEELSCFDYCVIDRNEDTGKLLIQIVMARRTLIEEMLNLLRELDLYPVSIKFSSIGFQNILLAHQDGYPKNSAAMVVRVEPEVSELVVATKGQQLFSEAFYLAPEEMTADRLLEESAAFVSSLEPAVEDFSKIYITGSLAKDLLEPMKAQVEDTELLVTGLDLKTKAISASSLDAYLAAVGLAISGVSRLKSSFNLIPREHRKVGTRPSLIPTVTLAVCLLVATGGWITREYFQQTRLVDQVDEQIEMLDSQVTEAFRLREQVDAYRAELGQLQEMLDDRQLTLLILRDLTERIPDDTYLQNLQIQGNQVTMQGSSNQASNLPPLLLESPYLESVKTNWIQQNARGEAEERFNFTATVSRNGGDDEEAL